MPQVATIKRPRRWDQPMSDDMGDRELSRLMALQPFSAMDDTAFPKSLSLSGILTNDCRIVTYEKGDIIVREGDYGSSAFLLLSGEAIVSLLKLPDQVTGRSAKHTHGWMKTIAQLWSNSSVPESRDYLNSNAKDRTKTTSTEVNANGAIDGAFTGIRMVDDAPRVFLHDIPRVIPAGKSVPLSEGEIFGELSAMTRTPRSATVVAGSKATILEIRWQGFREMMKYSPQLKQHVQKLYRQNSLKSHLRETKILASLSDDLIEQVAAATQFESFGDFQWSDQFRSTSKQDIAQRILAEPLIATEGHDADALLLVRTGFARLSRSHGEGHQTIAYLGKGETFGLRELAHNWQAGRQQTGQQPTGQQRPWMLSLRAVGYVDVLKIPAAVVESLILPNIPASELPPAMPSLHTETPNRRAASRQRGLDQNLMEFLVDRRYVNGTQAMVIDLDRCTRCDDCVKACASTHDNNPRFIRHGEKHDNWMFATACMHCLDPVCMIGCPTGAIGRAEDTGNVTINDETCIGCSTCANSCPYQNIRMVDVNDRSGRPLMAKETGLPIVKATKCDLCADQVAGPACQRACPHDALVRIDLTTPDPMQLWSDR